MHWEIYVIFCFCPVAAAAEATCTWPACVHKCFPCQSGLLGKCEWTVINLGASCPAAAGPVECYLGRCFCAAGTCPNGFIDEGDAQNSSDPFRLRTATRCEPQLCLPGANPPRHEPSAWAKFFSLLSGNQHVPDAVFADAVNASLPVALFYGEDKSLTAWLLFPAVLLLGIGIAITLEMLIRIECHTSRKVKEIMAGHMRVEASQISNQGKVEGFTLLDIDDDAQTLSIDYSERNKIEEIVDQFKAREDIKKEWVHIFFDKDSNVLSDSPGCAKHKQTIERASENPGQWPITVFFMPRDCEIKVDRPSVCPMFTLALFTLILTLGVVVIKAYGDLNATLDIIDASMERAHRDAVVVAKQGHVINSTAQGFQDSLDMITTHCGKSMILAPFIAGFENETGPVIKQYVTMAYDIGQKLAAGPGAIEEIHESFNERRNMFSHAPLLPAALITVLCLGMVIEAFAVEMCNSSTIAFEIDCSLRVATVIFAVVIMVVTAVGALELLLANSLSLLCNEVDHNIVAATQAFVGLEFHNVSVHYVLGGTYNPLAQMIQSANRMIYEIVMEYEGIEKTLTFLGKVAMCPVTNFVHIRKLSATALELLDAHINPYYEQVVRQGICGTVINALGWILFAQLSVGLVLFPLCIYFTHTFLTRWAVWEWAKEHARETGVDMGNLSDSMPIASSSPFASSLPSFPSSCFESRSPTLLSEHIDTEKLGYTNLIRSTPQEDTRYCD